MTKCKRAVATDSCTNAINIKQDAQRMRNILPAGLQAWGAVHKWKLYSIVMIKIFFFGKEKEYKIDVFFYDFYDFFIKVTSIMEVPIAGQLTVIWIEE